MFRWLTAGESHGRALVAICDGVPAGVRITSGDVAAALARRRAGYGRGARMKFEQDEVELTGGVRHGVTLGGPVAIRVGNTEWPKWETVMAPDPVDAGELADQARNAPLTRPRPGHADLAGMQKFGHADARPILERASARETAARVALGEVARRLLDQSLGVRIVSHVVALGAVVAPDGAPPPAPEDLARIDEDPLRCADAETSAAMIAEVDAARKDGDTLGGVVEVLAYGLPPGLGSFTQWDRRLDARLAGALMSVQAIKGVEFGDGFVTSGRRGSGAHDEIFLAPDGVRRRTNRAGGVEGGMSTGDVLRVRVAMKPISTVPRALETVDVSTGEPATAINQRSDVTAVPAAGVVAEAMAALVLAEAATEKFGGDSVEELRRNAEGYLKSLVIVTAPGSGAVVVLIGPPSAGKSSVGALLAAELGVPFADTDDLVAAAAGKPVGDIFVDDGEPVFRELERAAVARGLESAVASGASSPAGGVLALGSGAVLDPDVRRMIAGRPIVYLEASFAAIAKRTGMDRPRVVIPGNPRGMLRAMLEERRPVYAELATITVPTDDMAPDEVAADLAKRLRA
jgi:chorismate synthase